MGHAEHTASFPGHKDSGGTDCWHKSVELLARNWYL